MSVAADGRVANGPAFDVDKAICAAHCFFTEGGAGQYSECADMCASPICGCWR
jgi:hypothetical protein